MAEISSTFVRRCAGGAHTVLAHSINSGPSFEVTYQTDLLRAPLSQFTTEERDLFLMLLLKVHFAGRTFQQVVNEFNAGPVVVTI